MSLWPIARAEEVLPSPPLFHRQQAHARLRLQPLAVQGAIYSPSTDARVGLGLPL